MSSLRSARIGRVSRAELRVVQSELHLCALWGTLQCVTGSGVEVSCATKGESIQRYASSEYTLIAAWVISLEPEVLMSSL